MNSAQKKSPSIRGIKKFTASTVAERMSYWMRKSTDELLESQDDGTLSALDKICINALLSDVKYGKLKNMDVMLSRIIGTPVNQMNIQQTVTNTHPVHVELVGVEVGDENSLKALEDLKQDTESESESGAIS